MPAGGQAAGQVVVGEAHGEQQGQAPQFRRHRPGQVVGLELESKQPGQLSQLGRYFALQPVIVQGQQDQ